MGEIKYINVDSKVDKVFTDFINLLSNFDEEVVNDDLLSEIDNIVGPLNTKNEYDPLYYPLTFLKFIIIDLMRNRYSIDEILETVELYYDQLNISPQYKQVNDIIRSMYVEVYEPNLRDNDLFDPILYSKYLEHLVANGNNLAKEIKAYLYYCDGAYTEYETNFYKCREILEELLVDETVKESDKARYANTLGYIYYYGRCNDGVPQYEKAIKYYSLGHVLGVYESTIKLSDCFYGGKGIEKNRRAAIKLLGDINEDLYEEFLCGEFGSSFADLMIRLGRIHGDTPYTIDHLNAIYYYLSASFALKLRIKYENNFYDRSLLKRTQTNLNELKDCIRHFAPKKKMLSKYNILTLYHLLFEQKCSVTIKELKNEIKVILKPLNSDMLMVVIPEFDYVELTEKAVFRFKKSDEVQTHGIGYIEPTFVKYFDEQNLLALAVNNSNVIILGEDNCTYEPSNLDFNDID